jgi:Putative Flp pilus-assembly TadE/G-like
MKPACSVTRKERGQTLLLFVLAVGVLMGFVAMAIDVGLFYEDRRHLQNTADAAALAGVAELPKDPALAEQKAAEWAVNNGISSSEIKSIEIRTTDFPNDTVFVEVEGEFDWIFGRVLGQTTSAVSAKAAAQVGSLVGGNDLMPWAMVMGDSDCLDASGVQIPGADCSVKVGSATGSLTGWYGALDLDANGGGSSEYESNIVDGTAETTYCSRGQTEPGCDTIEVNALTGNKVGGTGQGIETRLQAEATPGCDANGNDIDDFDEVFAANTSGSGASFSVACADSPRLIIIPIVTLNGVPVHSVTIEGWALAYLQGYSCVGDSTCNGKGHWEVQVTMVDAVYSQAAGFIGAFNPLSAVTVRRLIE